MSTADDVVVTGVGLAVPGMAGPGQLLGERCGDGFDPETALKGRELRHKDRSTRLAIRAIQPALEEAGRAGADGRAIEPVTTAIVISSNMGNADSVCEFVDTIEQHTSRGLNSLALPHTSTSGIAGWSAIHFGFRGPALTLSNGVTSGLDALHWGRNLIVAGRAETVVVVGTEPHNDVVHKLLGDRSVDGASAVILESATHAQERGARTRAVLGAYSCGSRPTAVREAGERDTVGLRLANAEAEMAGSVDLENQLGICSGALGVLQCAAAVAYFDDGGRETVLATASDPTVEAAVTFRSARTR